MAGRHTPLALSDKKATVLFFLLPDCPVSNSYAPEIKRICAEYEAKKIAAFVVHADPDVTIEQAKKHAKEYGLPCPVLLDPLHVLAKRTGVKMAPEVAVLGPDCKVLYRGRIDDGMSVTASAAPSRRSAICATPWTPILEGKAVADADDQGHRLPFAGSRKNSCHLARQGHLRSMPPTPLQLTVIARSCSWPALLPVSFAQEKSPPDIQQGRRPDSVSAMRVVPSAGEAGAVFASDVPGRQEARQAHRPGDAIAADAAVEGRQGGRGLSQ